MDEFKVSSLQLIYRPAVTLNESNLRSGLSINSRVSKKELFNAVKGLYSEPANDYQPQIILY